MPLRGGEATALKFLQYRLDPCLREGREVRRQLMELDFPDALDLQ